MAVRNLASGGVLGETGVEFAPGGQLSGRLSFWDQRSEVRAEVRHVTAVGQQNGRTRYLVGLEFLSFDHIDELAAAKAADVPEHRGKPEGERRRNVRIACASDAEIRFPVWTTVELVDISARGVLFSSTDPLDVGTRGELRIRLGDQSFAAQIEIRRRDVRPGAPGGHFVGVSFVFVEERNRRHLESFLELAH